MRPLILTSLTLCSLVASDLSTLLPSVKSNLRLEASRLEIQKAQEQLDEAKTAYFPTITATGIYQRKDRTTAFEPQKFHGFEVGGEITVFDGFRREALLDALKVSKNGVFHNAAQEEQNILMETIAAYYDYLDAQDRLAVNRDKKTELSAQVARSEILAKNDLLTTDVLKSLVASKLEADYEEQNLRTLLEKHRKTLELLTSQSINDPLGFQEINTPAFTTIERHDLASDRFGVEILRHTEDRYTYLPSLSLGAKHKSYTYRDYDTMGGTNVQPENQNEITAALSMTLFDMGRISKEREQARIDTLKAQKLLDYKTKSLQNDAAIAILSIQTAQNAYQSALAEYEARMEAFTFVKKRFEAGLLNSTAYLTELTALSQSQARKAHARNALQVAKASAAYTHGIDLLTLIEDKK